MALRNPTTTTPRPLSARHAMGLRTTRTRLVAVALVASATTLSGCGALFSGPLFDGGGSQRAEATPWLTDGVVAISRPAPAPTTAFALANDGGAPQGTEPEAAMGGDLLDSASLLGFLPLPPTQAAVWLSVDTRAGKLSLMRGSALAIEVPGAGLDGLKPGIYSVLHKQTDPLWYAPDSYFERRGLPVPPEGDRARLRRGALGERAVFLDKDTPLHSGPTWSPEVGGVQIAPADLGSLYDQLAIGTKVEVK